MKMKKKSGSHLGFAYLIAQPIQPISTKKYITIEIHARAFLAFIILAIAGVYSYTGIQLCHNQYQYVNHVHHHIQPFSFPYDIKIYL